MSNPQDASKAFGQQKLSRLAYPINEAAYLLGISRASIYRHADDGKIRLIHIGGRALIPETEIVRLSSKGTK